MNEQLTITTEDPETLICDPANARTHNRKNYDAIRRSIKQFGIRKPIVAHEKTRIVYAGNATLQVCLDEGIREIPVAWIPADTPESLCKAYAIADNRTTDLSDWDLPQLDAMLEFLKEFEIEPLDLGFEPVDLDELFADSGESTEVTEDEYEAEPPETPVSQAGDLWYLGKHRVVCGDCTDRAVVDRVTDGERAVLMATDPPYGVNFKAQKYNPKAKNWRPIIGDDKQGEILQTWLTQVIEGLLPFMSDDAAYYFWSAAKQEAWHLLAAAAAGLHIQSQIVWKKNHAVLGQADYQWQHENCWYYYRQNGKKHRWFGGRTQTTVWEVDRVPTNKYLHPTQKPIELFAIPIRNHTLADEICLDPLLGSGSQLIACEQLNRVCRGIEIEPRYIDVIVKRYAAFVESADDIFCERDGERIPYNKLFGATE